MVIKIITRQGKISFYDLDDWLADRQYMREVMAWLRALRAKESK